MSAHRYWKVGYLYAGPSTAGNGLSMAECYLRDTVGGANKIPAASAESSSYSGSYIAAYTYDGLDTTLWHINGSASAYDRSAWVSYDYGAGNEFVPAEITITSRNDVGTAYNQTPYEGRLYWSDDGINWYFSNDFVLAGAFTSAGQTQTADLTAITPDILVQKAATLVVGLGPAEGVEVQKLAAQVVGLQNPPLLVQKAAALVVGLGRVANPHVRPWTFTMDGHDFLVVRTYSMTLIYDFESGNWMTWGIGDNEVWPVQVGQNWNADLGAIFPGFGGQDQTTVICGDDTFDTLYFLDPELVDDMSFEGAEGQKFLRVITGQLTARGHDYISCPMVEITGSNGAAPVGVDLTVELKISDDRGNTYWSAGTQSVVSGEYDITLAWSGLGSYTGPGRLLRFLDYGSVYRVDGLDMVDGQ